MTNKESLSLPVTHLLLFAVLSLFCSIAVIAIPAPDPLPGWLFSFLCVFFSLSRSMSRFRRVLCRRVNDRELSGRMWDEATGSYHPFLAAASNKRLAVY